MGTGMFVASRILLIVFVLAPVIALAYALMAVAHLKPGVRAWLDAPLLNPLNHMFVSGNLTEEGLKYRRRAMLAMATSLLAWFASAGLDSDSPAA